jgi:adenine phosphoribosyltransferase
LATGGSLCASIELIEKIGGVIDSALVIIELSALGGRKKIDCKVHSFIKYDDIE